MRSPQSVSPSLRLLRRTVPPQVTSFKYASTRTVQPDHIVC
jgi:hypothetical protein